MTQNEFIKWSYKRAKEKFPNLSKAFYEEFTKFMLKSIQDAILKDGKLSIRGFGKFKKVKINRTSVYNPWTKEKINISGRETVKFYASNSFKNKVLR